MGKYKVKVIICIHLRDEKTQIMFDNTIPLYNFRDANVQGMSHSKGEAISLKSTIKPYELEEPSR